MVYHDALAEIQPKDVEETAAAELFEQDLKQSGRYSEDLISLTSNALRNKESDVMRSVAPPFSSDTSSECSADERTIRRILRLADRIDVIRCTLVPAKWKEPQNVSSVYTFDSRFLDLPETMTQSKDFKKAFDDLMEGAKDLAYVTGGAPYGDNSQTGSYLMRYNLQTDNSKRMLKVTRAVNAYDSVLTALNDNVRRAMAREAGLNTCTANHSKEYLSHNQKRAACVVNEQGKQKLTAIHSESELRQVHLPKDMTVLEKLLYEQQGLESLQVDRKMQVSDEISRLKQEGIKPPPGTLTQQTLTSEIAAWRLRESHGIKVTSERRFCGYTGKKPNYTTILVPVPINSSSAASPAPQQE